MYTRQHIRYVHRHARHSHVDVRICEIKSDRILKRKQIFISALIYNFVFIVHAFRMKSLPNYYSVDSSTHVFQTLFPIKQLKINIYLKLKFPWYLNAGQALNLFRILIQVKLQELSSNFRSPWKQTLRVSPLAFKHQLQVLSATGSQV